MLTTEQNPEIEERNTKLFALIAHDVKGPIEIMRTAVEYINAQKSKISQHEVEFLLHKFEQELGSVSDMLNNLLIWAKEQQYGLNIDPRPLSLYEEVELSLEILKHYARQKGVQLINNIEEDFTLITDKEMLQVILRNLISNAIKFSHPQTSVTIEMIQGIATILISVSDSGIGMSDMLRNRILNNEKVNSRYGTAKEKGIGLGLSLSKEFIEKLGGKMNIKCMEGKGTSVCFTLPI